MQRGAMGVCPTENHSPSVPWSPPGRSPVFRGCPPASLSVSLPASPNDLVPSTQATCVDGRAVQSLFKHGEPWDEPLFTSAGIHTKPHSVGRNTCSFPAVCRIRAAWPGHRLLPSKPISDTRLYPPKCAHSCLTVELFYFPRSQKYRNQEGNARQMPTAAPVWTPA